MPIDSKHPLYDAFIARWQRCRDACEGDDAVKSRKVKYLPKPGGLDQEQYNAYVQRALFYEAPGRTIDGFVGAMSRKDAVVNVPEKLNPIVEDATADGTSLNEFAKRLCSETILQGRAGVLVDYDDKLGRSYLSVWQTENITNWSDNYIVLFEIVYEADLIDKFKQVATEQYRELSIIDGSYTVTLWRKTKDQQGGISTQWAIYGDPVIPTMRGKSLAEMPFFWLTPLGKTSRIEVPPMLGLVNVCLSHYQNSADLEHGLHFSGLPTLYATGISDPDKPIIVGSLAVICIPDANAKVAYAEVNGDFNGLESAMMHKEQKMAVLGAAVFHDGAKGVEAAETARIRKGGETSLLVGVTTAVEATLKSALQCAADWMNATGEIEITLNREYVDITIDGPTLTGLVQAYQAGALTVEQFLYNMQQGDLLSPDTEIAKEALAVKAAAKQKMQDAITLAQSSKPDVEPAE